jgi:hypothetical protein
MWGSSTKRGRLAVALAAGLAALAGGADAKPRGAPVPITYVAPTNPEHQPLYEALKSKQVLEKVQAFFNLFPMKKPFGFKLTGCDGEVNAWYDEEERLVTLCYDYLQEQLRIAPTGTTQSGVSREDVMLGATLEVVLHEGAHALFDVFKIPILGREEDAADQVAAFTLLQLGDDVARSTVGGVAYMYATEARGSTPGMKEFANEHGLPAQRFFNWVCIAYGAKPKLFADVVAKGYLPEDRAESCEQEYRQVAYAVSTLLGPHMDERAAARFKASFSRRKPVVRTPPR